MTLFPAAPHFDPAPFLARRQRVLAHMQAEGGGIAILPTAAECTRNRDACFPFRFDSDFHYLSGFDEPDALLVLIADDSPRSILFCRPKDKTREIWEGCRHGPAAAAELFGFDQACTIDSVDERLPELMSNQVVLWFGLAHDERWDSRIGRALNESRNLARSGCSSPHTVQDLRAVLHEMRLIKDDSEIALMRRAGAISAQAHCRAMCHTRPGQYEYEIEAELLHTFRRFGCQAPAYTSIVASGANACILHYVDNKRCMQDGELLLIDAGGELDGYAADISRTFPVNGRFSSSQRAVYELVLAAAKAAQDAVRPGANWNDPHEAAVAILAQGLLDLKLLRGSMDEVLEQELYRRFYMHRTGHWLGRDVHDVGEYKLGAQWRPLLPGMVFTIEPGCYIHPADDLPEAFWNIGIRIEDNFLVTDDGYECFTEAVPREVAAIEMLMSSR